MILIFFQQISAQLTLKW